MNIFFKIVILTICLLFINGCVSKKYEEFITVANSYMEHNGKHYLNYLESDKTLTNREKEGYKARHRLFDNTLKTLVQK
jgi:hypothetical protein